ncbi:MAG TPA: hypothetical protein VIY47_15345 [Ignavibacteriaceae bacterium]
MRLYEFIMPMDTYGEFEDPEGPQEKRLKKLHSQGDEVSSGGYATVFSHDLPKRLNQVRKMPNKEEPSFENDPYILYVKSILKLKENGYKNSYFPRIIKFKEVKDRNSQNSYIVDIETLHHEDTFDNEVINSIKKKIFHNTERIGKITNPDMAALIVDAYEKNPENIKDTEFLQALNIIHRIDNNFSETMFDISGQFNHMYRISGTMPQLVLSDPLG